MAAGNDLSICLPVSLNRVADVVRDFTGWVLAGAISYRVVHHPGIEVHLTIISG